MNATASSASDSPVRTGETELFPYRLSLPRSLVAKADFLVTIAMLGDIAMILAGLALGYWIRFRSGLISLGNESHTMVFYDYLGLMGLGALFLLMTFGYLRLYDPRKIPGFRATTSIVLKGTAFWLLAFVSVSLVMKFQPTISRLYVFVAYLSCVTSVLAWRWLFCRLLRTRSIATTLRKRILFIGWTAEAARMTGMIEKDPDRPYEVAGWIPAPLGRGDFTTPRAVPLLGDCSQLPALLHQHEIDVVLLADLGLAYSEIVGLSNLCEKELIEFKIIPSYFQILLSGLHLEPVSGVPVLGVADLPLNRLINRTLKRSVDILGACVGLLLSAPVIGVFGTLVRLESPGAVFFGQERIGRNGKPFKMYKIRTMRPTACEADHMHQSTLREDPRLLRVGKFMRRWNLDEVPQFWNVLKGDMSLVGPRPERTYHSRQLSEVIPHYNARLASKPGLTGWAQVNGLRGDTSLEERVRYDLHYLENWSLWFDLQTMIQTFLRRDNAY